MQSLNQIYVILLITAEVGASLTTLNAQLASYIQAHSSYMMKSNGAEASARNRMEHVLDGYRPSRHKGVPLNSY